MSQKAAPKRIRNREQVSKALELRKAGASYQGIADALCLKSKSRAHTLVMEGLDELNATCKETAEQLRAQMLERLDSIQLALWKGRANPRTADTLLRIEERRAKLHGLDAPTKTALTDPEGNDIGREAAAALHAKLLG